MLALTIRSCLRSRTVDRRAKQRPACRATSLDREADRVSCIEIGTALIEHVSGVPKMAGRSITIRERAPLLHIHSICQAAPRPL